MGPIRDRRGVEQQGVSSGDLLQLSSNSELETLDSLNLGVTIAGILLSMLPFVDDKSFFSTIQQNLQSLMDISSCLSSMNGYTFEPTNTNILALNPDNH